MLLCHVLRWERSFLFAHPEYVLTEDELDSFTRAVAERLTGKPTQYITGVQEFYGREFLVDADVMIPRPETEHIIEAALRYAPGCATAVDVGCGSGAIAVTLQLETGCRMLATDISSRAIGTAIRNARRLNASVMFAVCDLLSAVAPRSAELVLSNPPYVPNSDEASLQREVRDFEPHVALFGGEEGLDFYRRLAVEAPRVLRPGGWLIMELGIRQLAPVQAMLGKPDWDEQHVVHDLAGLPRTLAVRYRR